jgi:SagB-type dehydrogenase family enzyme
LLLNARAKVEIKLEAIMFQVSRDFLKDNVRRAFDFSQTDQNRGIEAPPNQKPYGKDSLRIDLVGPRDWKNVGETSVREATERRRSRRKYRSEALTLEELSFLLWATQGIRGKPTPIHAYRTVPSAGCRHALETYLAALNVEGLSQALYRYLPVNHQLVQVAEREDLGYLVGEAASEQFFAGQCAAAFFWTAVPYRMEWRYGPASFKLIALDAGHVCQSLYLACEAIGAGTCAIAAYDQQKADAVLGLDGQEEFVIYMAPVGKV